MANVVTVTVVVTVDLIDGGPSASVGVKADVDTVTGLKPLWPQISAAVTPLATQLREAVQDTLQIRQVGPVEDTTPPLPWARHGGRA